MKNIISKIFASLAVVAAILFAPISATAQFADQATYIATPGGTANAITLAVDNWNINRPGVVLRFLPAAQNTGATTVVVNGVGSAISLKKLTGLGLTNLTGGELNTTEISQIVFDGAQWQLLARPGNPAAPQGYLTPCQTSSPSPVAGCSVGNPFVTTDVVSATTLYYEGIGGPTVPIYNGGQFVPTVVTEAQMTLILSGTANTANNIYDVCIYNNAGTPAIGTLPAWSNAGLGTGARSTAVSFLQGVLVNGATATVTNNNVGVSVAQNLCTVVATIMIDGVNGQVTLQRTAGQSRRWAVSNIYNQKDIQVRVTDATATWNYGVAGTVRPSNGATANSARIVSAWASQPIGITTLQKGLLNTAYNSSVENNSGACWNVTSAFTGSVGSNQSSVAAGPTGITVGGSMAGQASIPPFIGAGLATMCEAVPDLGSFNTFFGTEKYMLMTLSFKG